VSQGSRGSLWVREASSSNNVRNDTHLDMCSSYFPLVCFPCRGPVGDWDVSLITEFSDLFCGTCTFNEDISRWDVSSGVTFASEGAQPWLPIQHGHCNFSSLNHQTHLNLFLPLWQNGMFATATTFDQDLSGWNVSRGTNFVSSDHSIAFRFKVDHGWFFLIESS
jgi:hypothetical protein